MKFRIFLLIIGFSILVWGCEEGIYDHSNPPSPGDDEVGLVVAPSNYGGYFVAGQKFYAGSESDQADLYLAFFDEDGRTQWTTTYATDMHNEPLAARETGDHGFLVLAERSSGSQAIYYLLEVDDGGRVQWRQDLSTNDLHRVVDADATEDGGFILLGYSGSNEAATLLKTDSQGGVSFISAFNNHYVPADVQEVANGYVLLSNVSRNDDSSTVSLIRTNSLGQLQWANLVWSWDWWVAWHVAEDADGNLFVVAEQNSGQADASPLVIKTDSQGHYLWRQDYGETSGSTINAVVSNWNGLLLAGDMTNGGGDHDGFAMRAGHDGEWQWWRTYGEDHGNDWISDAISGNNGGYILAGSSASYSRGGDTDIYLTKISSDGTILWDVTAGD